MSFPQEPSSYADSPELPEERWYQALAETSSTAIMVMADHFLYANAATEKLLGYSVEELQEMAPVDLVHSDFREKAGQRFDARLRGEDVIGRYEMVVQHKDGTSLWIDYHATYMELAGRKVILAEATDISDRKMAEVVLEESELRLRSLVEGTSGVTGDDFFQSLVGHLAVAFRAPTAFVAELVPPERRRLVVLGLWSEGGLQESRSYDLEESVVLRPCFLRNSEGVAEGSPFPAPIPEPIDTLLRDLGAPFYRVSVFVDSSGDALGLLGIAGSEELGEASLSEPILKIFASRAAAELERSRVEEALSREKELAQVTLASIGDGVIRTDAEGRVNFLNPVASWLLGWRQEAAKGRPVSEVYRALDETSRSERSDPVALCLERQRLIVEPAPKVLLRRGDGAEFSIRDSAAPIRNLEGAIIGAVLVFKDVTELRGMEREMRFLESHDALTGLANRVTFRRRLEAALTTVDQRSHVLCFLDLDNFKLVNDSFGTAAGDEILKAVAAVLRSRVREGDTTARLGSDEFGVLFENCPLDLARSLVQSIQDSLREQTFTWWERSFECTASVGLVPVTEQFSSVAQVLSVAQGACYLAQQKGRHHVHEYQVGDTAVGERLEEMQWVHRIHQAFDEDRFILYQQPFFPLQGEDLEPISEIFLRMVGEDGEILPPGAFIQAAEHYRLVSTIDRWVVAQALKVLSRRDSHLEGIFTINLSAQSLTEHGFLEEISSLLEQAKVDSSRICFEITETAAIANMDHAMRFFRELRQRGCRFLLDDFGSGMSSLAYLKNLPVDFLKIDGEFVRNISTEPVQSAMVESIQRISQLLGIRTIGECVETASTLETLRGIGVDYAQGYWLAEPQPLEQPDAAVGGSPRSPEGRLSSAVAPPTESLR